MSGVIAAIDFSNISETILLTAISEAKAFKDKLYVIHVVVPEPEFIGYSVGPKTVRDKLAVKFHEEHTCLQGMRKRAEEEECDCVALLHLGMIWAILLNTTPRLVRLI